MQFQSGVVGDDYQDIEIEAAGGTVLYSHEGQEIDRSLKQSSSTTTTTNEDERENVSLISEESEIVPDVGLIDDLKIGHFEVSVDTVTTLSKNFIDFFYSELHCMDVIINLLGLI